MLICFVILGAVLGFLYAKVTGKFALSKSRVLYFVVGGRWLYEGSCLNMDGDSVIRSYFKNILRNCLGCYFDVVFCLNLVICSC